MSNKSFKYSFESPYAKQALFDVISDIKVYPKIFSKCTDTVVKEISKTELEGTLFFRIGFKTYSIKTLNKINQYNRIEMTLLTSEVFHYFKGVWLFSEISSNKTLISFEGDYDCHSFVMNQLLHKFIGYGIQPIQRSFEAYIDRL